MKQVEIASASFHPDNPNEKLDALAHIKGKVNHLLGKYDETKVTWLQSSSGAEGADYRFTQLTGIVEYDKP